MRGPSGPLIRAMRAGIRRSTEGVGNHGGVPEISYPTASASLLRGRVDAFVVLVLWIARRASWALLFLGGAAAIWFGDVAEALELDTFGEVLAAMFTPLAPLAIAIIFRVAVAFTALLSAAAIGTREAREVPGATVGSVFRRLSGIWHISMAHRARRWTWPVRNLAVARLGRPGRVLDILDRSLIVAAVAAAVGLVGVVVFQP